MFDVSEVIARLPNEDVLRLYELARKNGTTKTAALVRAIRTTKYLEDAIEQGSTVYLRDRDGTFRAVVFK